MRFFLRLLIVIIGVFIVDASIGYICKNLLINLPNNGSPLSIDKQNLFEEKSDVVLMGASQVKHGYNPQIFEDTLKLSTYNYAQDGVDVIQNYIYINEIVKRHIPQYIIFDIHPAYLDGSMKYRIRLMNMWYGLNESVTDYFNNQANGKKKSN